MGQQSGSQTQTTNPWGPSIPARNAALGEASRLYQSSMGPKAPTRDQFTSTIPGYQTGGYVTQGNATGQTSYWSPTGKSVPAQQKFDEMGFNQALQNYQSQPTYVDPIAQAVQRYQGQLTNTPLEENTYGMVNDTVSGKYLDGNPYIESMIGRTNAGVNANFSGAGRYGSGAHQGYLAEAGNALRYQNYNDERGRMMQGAALAPQAAALRYQPYEQGINLAQELEDIPANRLARYVDILNAASNGGGSVTSPIYRNRAAGAAGGAMAGASVGGPYAALLGAGLGFLAS
jgi:hypothetical protein